MKCKALFISFGILRQAFQFEVPEGDAKKSPKNILYISERRHTPFFRTPSLFHCADTHASCHLEDPLRNGTCSLLLLVVHVKWWCNDLYVMYIAATWTNRNPTIILCILHLAWTNQNRKKEIPYKIYHNLTSDWLGRVPKTGSVRSVTVRGL